jgi:hypothetical protein
LDPEPDAAPYALSLTLLPAGVALCRLSTSAAVPEWTTNARTFLTISRTPTELSIVADEAAVPAEVDARRGYRILRVDGPLPLHVVGVIAALATALAAARVPIFPIATYDTDYLLVPEPTVQRAVAALADAGYRVAAER